MSELIEKREVPAFILLNYFEEAAAYYGFYGTVSGGCGYALTINYFKHHYPQKWTKLNINLLESELPGIVGSYPTSSSATEIGVDAAMIALMFIIFCLFLTQYIRNQQVGHVFRPSLLVLADCALAMAGWGCRIAWSRDFSNFHLGLASYFIITLTEYLLPLASFTFACSVYEFMHPGSRRAAVVWYYTGSFIGLVSFILCVVAPSLLYYHYFDYSALHALDQVELAGAAMGVAFHMMPIILIIVALTKKSKHPKDHELVSQAYWINRFGPFDRYEPQPIAEEVTKFTISMHQLPGRGQYSMAHEQMERGPKLKLTVWLFMLSTLLLWSCALVRLLAISYEYDGGVANAAVAASSTDYVLNEWFSSSKEAIWVFYGGFQGLALLMWFFMRVDLRFYSPTKSPEHEKLSLKKSNNLYD